MLYSLSLFNERQKGFFIGLFVSHEKAWQTVEHYLSAVPGFRDYPCTYEITEKTVIGTIPPSGKVYMIWSWDEDENGNETGVWSSGCYADKQDAQRALEDAQRHINRQEWSLDTYQVGQCLWTEGFVRIFPLEQGIYSDGQMLLLRGITGFRSVNANPPPFLDEKAFRRMCHALAQKNGGIVTEVDTDTASRNFYSAKLSRYDQSVFLLQNSHYPYGAFAQRDTSGGFILAGQPEWLQLSEVPVCFLSPAELNQDWRGLCGELSPEELKQIRYWNPQTVGEFIFNTWD